MNMNSDSSTSPYIDSKEICIGCVRSDFFAKKFGEKTYKLVCSLGLNYPNYYTIHD